ncbi:hypothetical protein IJG78_01300 [Candidatus Saccharibacteria bacterium]|nr:hypothetical protein [Candidatus Saccharibacteria bacterium]
MYRSTGSTKARRYPLSYIYSGYYTWIDGRLSAWNTHGYWWSTSANSSTNAYRLDMNSSELSPQTASNKIHGFTLRCIT